MATHNFGLPTLDRFPQFSAIALNWRRLASRDCRKQQKSIKLGHFYCYPLPRSRSFSIRNHRQSTLGPSIFLRKRNTETRDRRCVVRGVSRRTTTHVFNPRSRVSALLIVARGRGTKCAWLIVAGNRRSATPRIAPASQLAHSRSGDMREDGTGNGQPFSICAVSRRTSGQISATGMPMTRNRANRKTAEGQRVGDPLPLPLSDSVGNNSKRALSCFTSRSKPPSILPAQTSVFQNRNGDV